MDRADEKPLRLFQNFNKYYCFDIIIKIVQMWNIFRLLFKHIFKYRLKTVIRSLVIYRILSLIPQFCNDDSLAWTYKQFFDSRSF